MDPRATYDALMRTLETLSRIGAPFQYAMLVIAVALAAFAVVPQLERWRGWALGVTSVILLAGEGLLGWFHWQLYRIAAVVDPTTGMTSGHVAVPLWVESEKLYVWALMLAVIGTVMRRHREELLPGVLGITAILVAGAALQGKPFTEPVPSFLGQYVGYLQAMASGVTQAAYGAYQGMEGSRQFYYNAWYMWVHPPMLFASYGCFAVSFVATIQMIRHKHSSYETTSYRWARTGFLWLTLGMLLGFPWALSAWTGESWWWSGKVNMSLMMWLLYTAVLHARLYLRRAGMWKAVAILSVISFLILVLTYITTYVVPGAHSYAASQAIGAMAFATTGAPAWA